MCLSEEWKKWTDCCGDEALVAAIRLGSSDESEGLVATMKERCKGDLHQRGCMKCKRALGKYEDPQTWEEQLNQCAECRPKWSPSCGNWHQ
eukprot:359624-Prorocentrum_lima.AAC.1